MTNVFFIRSMIHPCFHVAGISLLAKLPLIAKLVKLNLGSSNILSKERTTKRTFKPCFLLPILKKLNSATRLTISRYFRQNGVRLGNEFVTHFISKCLEMRKKERSVVLNKPRKSFGFWCFPWQLLAMGRAEEILFGKLVACFTLGFRNKSCLQKSSKASYHYKLPCKRGSEG